MTLACKLPDGRSLTIGPAAADNLSCGVVVLSGIEVVDRPQVAEEAESVGREYVDRYAGLNPSEIPPLAEARTLYKSFGMDPSRHRPSSEALLRRMMKGQGLYRISNVVDGCNLASLSFLLPIGMYDLDCVEGDVTLRSGNPGEEYPGIRKGMVHLEGRLGLFDEKGPFGSPTSDSARTCTRESTTSVLAVIMATAGYPASSMAAHLERFAEIFTIHCGGTAEFSQVLGGRT